MLAMLKEGTTSRNSIQIAEEQERLGANIDVGASMDRTAVSMYALMPNLDASMDLMADVIKNPAFDPKELERIRDRKSVVEGKSVPVRVDLGGRRILKQKSMKCKTISS